MRVDSTEITPLQKPLDATVEVPGSKSYTNRALLVAALAEGESLLTGALFSDDTDYMVQSLRKLGVAVEADPAVASFSVRGNGGKIPVANAELYIGNSGTTSRSIISYAALGDGRHGDRLRAGASGASEAEGLEREEEHVPRLRRASVAWATVDQRWQCDDCVATGRLRPVARPHRLLH